MRFYLCAFCAYGKRRSQRPAVSTLLELNLEVVVSCLMRLLGGKLVFKSSLNTPLHFSSPTFEEYYTVTILSSSQQTRDLIYPFTFNFFNSTL